MSEELTTTTMSALSAEKKSLYRRMYAPSATDSEFETFITLAQTYDLRPELHEIWCVKYGNAPAQIFAGRDGIRAVAQKTDMIDGVFFDTELDNNGKPIKSTCTINKKGCSHPFVKTAYFREYNTGKSLWQSKPITMLEKVAECQCLRMAFNLNGLYDESEFGDVQKPTKISQEGSITVTPDKPVEVQVETYDEATAMRVKENMEYNQGMNTDIFEKARLPNGRYDKKMIDDDFKRQRESKKPETASPKPVSNPGIKQMVDAYLNDVKTCEVCGKPVSAGEINASKVITGKQLCQACLNNTH